MSVTRTFTVTVQSTGSGNKYFIDGVQQDTLTLGETGTYKFDQADSSNNNHPLRFSTTWRWFRIYNRCNYKWNSWTSWSLHSNSCSY